MSTPSTVPDALAALTGIAQAYFDALADGNFARVPWSADIILRTPLHPDAPVEGRSSVEAFFRPMAGRLGPIRRIETYVNAARDTLVAEACVGPLHALDKFTIRSGEIVEQENFFDPRPLLEAPSPGGMSSDERALLVEMLETSRDRLRATVESAPDDSWNLKPEGGGWSAAECAEHLALTEDALMKIIRGQILSAPADPGLAIELRGKDGAVVRAMRDRSAKVKTFDFLEPRGNFASRLHALDAFLARRATTIDYARSSHDALHHHGAPLGELGLLDAYQWLLLLAGHTERHLAQMQEALNGV